MGGTPSWLSTPVHHEDLASDIPYTYLAANLIIQGAVDARACPDGGLLPGGGVNACGLEAARPAVNTWQDQFDGLILDASQKTGVPAHLLKNLFARESQFWPGVLRTLGDLGLGQLTENGADTTLIWNPSFFAQFCPLVLSGEACGKGYLHLKPYEQLLLRQALVGSVNATCADCPLGLDLGEANFSVTVFAHTMVANCEQAGRVVRNITGDMRKITQADSAELFDWVAIDTGENFYQSDADREFIIENARRAGYPRVLARVRSTIRLSFTISPSG